MTESPWDRIAKDRQNQLINNEDITFSEILYPTILNILSNFTEFSNFHILDIGCGTGFLTEKLSHLVKSIIGIDPSKESITAACELAKGNNISFTCMTVEQYSKSCPDKYDFVIAHMSLHVIQEVEIAVRSISMLLKDNSCFLFSIPHPCFWSIIKNKIGDDSFQYNKQSEHENIFRFPNGEYNVPYYHRSLEEYSRLLNLANLSVINILEPFPSPEVMDKYKRPWIYPGFLFVLTKKFNVETKNV